MSALLILQAVDGPLQGDRWVLAPETVYVGRDPHDCRVLLPRSAVHVSRLHASLTVTSDSSVCLLQDEGSKNGTFIEGIGRLEEGVVFSLETGRRFWIGHRDWSFEVRLGGETQDA